MKPLLLRESVLALTLALAGCATYSGESPGAVDVTRFHLNEPVARAAISVDPANPAERTSVEFSGYRMAVERQLARLGWTIVAPGGTPEQIALVRFGQANLGPMPRRSPISIGIGGSTGGWNSGIGGGINFGVGGKKRGDRIAATMDVSIRRRSDGTVFWEGRAQTLADLGATSAAYGPVAEKLAEALFRDFPGESGRTIRVP
jgi:hypothetical protein